MEEALLLSIGRLVCTTPWFVICCVPFYPYRRVNRRTMVLVITIMSVLFFLCNFFLRLWREDYATYGSIVFFCLYVVMICFFVWGVRMAPVKLLYMFLLVQAISTSINYTSAILLKPFYPDERITLQSTPVYTLIILLLTLILAPMLWYFFSHQLRDAMEELRTQDFWILCIPPTLIFFVTIIFNDLGANPLIPQEQSIAIFLLITVAGLATYFVNIRLVLNTARRSRLEADMMSMERQLAIQSQSYEKLTQSIEATQMARHDLRHHLAVMSSFTEEGNITKLSEYLDQYCKNIPDKSDPPICKNHAVDEIVRYYLQQAREAGAELDVKLDLHRNTGVLDTDLTIVFGNVFENAVHGVIKQNSGERRISARCGLINGNLILTVDNTFGSEKWHGETIKSVPGIGQTSVKAVVEKYRGTVRFGQDGNIYRASVLLEIPSKQSV